MSNTMPDPMSPMNPETDSNPTAHAAGPRHRDPGSIKAELVSWIVIVLVVGFIAASVFLGGKPSDIIKTGAGPGAAEAPSTGRDTESQAATPPTTTPAPSSDLPAPAATADAPSSPAAASAGPPIEPQPVAGMSSSIARLVLAQPPEQRVVAIPQIEMFAKTDTDKLRLAMFQGGIGELAPAQAALRKLIESEPARKAAFGSGPQVATDAKLALSVLRQREAAPRAAKAASESNEAAAPDKQDHWAPLTLEQRDELITRHGVFAQTLLLPEDDPALSEVRASGTRILGLLVLLGLAAIATGVLAFGLFVTAIVLLATGQIRSHCVAPLPGGSVYLESFALFLIGFIALSLLGAVGLPDSLSAVLRWALLGCAAWPLFRGVPFNQFRTDIGWTAGGPHARLAPVRWFKEMVLGIAGYLAMLPLLGLGLVATLIVMAVLTRLSGETQSAAHPLGDEIARAGIWGKVSLVILATVWAPLVEETFFRGALFRHLSGRLHWVLAGLLSGLIFASLHPQGLAGIPVLMMAGFNFAMLRQWRGGLIAPMTAHALNNGTITVLILLLTA